MEVGKGGEQRWRYDPFRPLDFRWQDACRTVARQAAKWTDRNDPVVRMLVRYQRSLDPASKIRVGRVERNQFAAIKAAQELAQQNDLLRWQVEALILAGATDSVVAERCGLAPATIAAYETAFFSVRQSLGAWCYLITRAVGHGPSRGFQDDELRQFWCWSALAGGLPIIDALVDGFRAACRPGDPPSLHVYLRDDAPLPLELQAFVASAVLPPARPLDWTYFGWNLQLIEADALRCPATARERVAKEMVKAARDLLAGKPLLVPNCTATSDEGQDCVRDGTDEMMEHANVHRT